MTDKERKILMNEMIHRIHESSTLIKCLLVYRSISEHAPFKSQCEAMKTSNQPTILIGEDVVSLPNPLYYPTEVSYTERVRCMWKHLLKSEFDKGDEVCKAPCDTCTFQNGVSRTLKKYFSVLSSGDRITMATNVLNTYYKYLKVGKPPIAETVNNGKQVLQYLKTVPIQLNLEGKIEEIEKEQVLKKMIRFMCQYGIEKTLEEQLIKRVDAKLAEGFSIEQILRCM